MPLIPFHAGRRALACAAILAAGTLSASGFGGIEAGPLTIGGALRANYVQGDYVKDDSGAPQRGGNGGNFELDVFRINLDFDRGGWLGKAEYRWYDGCNFFHTAWIGHESDAFGRLELGLTRTPFGVGPYGPANSWFFDQHYYAGLSDHMKLGATYSRAFGSLKLDVGYYLWDIPNGMGASSDSARYSYAVVDEDVADIPGAYRETHQINARAVYSIEKLKTDIGVSAQVAMLDAQDARAGNSESHAFSVHSKSAFGPVGVMLQLTSYNYDVDYARGADGVTPSGDLINLGAYDFAWPVASRGLIPSVALSYTLEKPISGIDSITFYNDYSVILKDGAITGRDFNDSALNVTGVAIARGNWYLYVDYALSNGHLFVGNEGDDYGDGKSISSASVGDFGVNGNDTWNGRFNINLGYYF
ncbi:MAG: hypothetical protein GX548_02395 [Lentisphaerae bacterium]|nr:hypothetical protein [Lentisphaerota bacterium]